MNDAGEIDLGGDLLAEWSGTAEISNFDRNHLFASHQ